MATTVLGVSSATTGALIAAAAALGGTLIGVIGTLVATVWQDRRAQAVRETEAVAARRERAAAILGRVRTFLTDIAPERVGINVNPETTPKALEDLRVRLNTLRDELSIFGAAADDDMLMARTAHLEVALSNAFHWASWHAHDLLQHRGPADTYHRARRWHLRANMLVRIVLDLVRGRDVSELEEQLGRVEDAEKQAA